MKARRKRINSGWPKSAETNCDVWKEGSKEKKILRAGETFKNCICFCSHSAFIEPDFISSREAHVYDLIVIYTFMYSRKYITSRC